jgi:hypothetical protein
VFHVKVICEVSAIKVCETTAISGFIRPKSIRRSGDMRMLSGHWRLFVGALTPEGSFPEVAGAVYQSDLADFAYKYLKILAIKGSFASKGNCQSGAM